ncbi:MAG: ATP-binding protein, partial [Candidatus Binatia bacterium]
EGRVSVTARITGSQAVVEVRDTGVGIAEAELPRIFERFFRSRCEYATKVGGTGLGLSIVKALVERHGGAIEVESELENGTCFRVTLPLHCAEGGTAAKPGPGRAAAGA